MTRLHALSLVCLFGSCFLVQAQDLLASLDYGSFKGSYSSTYNISYWRKIPFAAPPTGKNRFRAPQPPIPIINGTYNSDQSFDYCPQRTVNGSEDCLYLGLYSRPWKPPFPLRPVIVFFFGGAFIEGGGSFSLPPPGYPVLNVSNTADFIMVYPNYRVNAFGFLPGSQIAEDANSDLNPGLLDQEAALRWVYRYIGFFGGDRDNVTIWGQSAGAGSVVAQVIAHGGDTQPRLFRKALVSSPFWPKTYRYDAPEAQGIYDTLVNLTDCEGGDSLRCLKTVDVQRIREAALNISGSDTYGRSSYTWAPVIDGKFLRKRLTEATRMGEVNIDFGWGMYNTHEGENFIPPTLSGSPTNNTNNKTSFHTWLRAFLPGLSTHNIAHLDTIYPSTGSSEMIPTYNTSYTKAGLIYRDLVLACPAYWIARAARKKSYVGEYSIEPAKHASDTIWWNKPSPLQSSNPLTYTGFTGAISSFLQTGNPNTRKLTNATQPGVPETWRTGEEFFIQENGFKNLRIEELGMRCRFWRSVAGEVPI